MHNIRKGAPPTIVFLGTNDSLIPVATAERYKELMEAAGSRCDLHLYEGAAHGFFNFKRPGHYFEKTVLEMDRFLQSLGYLEGPATIEVPADEPKPTETGK
jgi:acetyl esterase/lipase